MNDGPNDNGCSEAERNIQLALVSDEHFRRLVIVLMTELSTRVKNLEDSTKAQKQQIAIVADQTDSNSGHVKAILAVGAAFFTIAVAFGGLFTWLWNLFAGGKTP